MQKLVKQAGDILLLPNLDGALKEMKLLEVVLVLIGMLETHLEHMCGFILQISQLTSTSGARNGFKFKVIQNSQV